MNRVVIHSSVHIMFINKGKVASESGATYCNNIHCTAVTNFGSDNSTVTVGFLQVRATRITKVNPRRNQVGEFGME